MSLCCSIPVAENKKHLVVVAAWGLFIYLSLRKNRTGFASRLKISQQPNYFAFILQCHTYM